MAKATKTVMDSNGQFDAGKLKKSLMPVFAAAARGSKCLPASQTVLVRVSPGCGLTAEIRGMGITAAVAVGDGDKRSLGPVALVDAMNLKKTLMAHKGPINVSVEDGFVLKVGFSRLMSGLEMKDLAPRPDMEGPTSARVVEKFGEIWDVVGSSVCEDETRAESLRCVLLGSLASVSTDGHRLHLIGKRSDDRYNNPEGGVLLPALVGSLAAKGGAKDLTVETIEAKDGKRLCASWTDAQGSEVVVVTDAVAADFPPYEQVIPRSHANKVVVNAKVMREMCAQIFKLTNEGSFGGVKISQNSTGLLLTMADNSADFHLPVVSGSLPEDFVTGFMSSYIVDAMDAAGPNKGDNVNLLFDTSPLDPLVVEGSAAGQDVTCVIMPMRI